MIIIFPFALWLAAITSVVLLLTLSIFGELGRRGLLVLPGWFLVAGYCQFLGDSSGVRALGLLLQTMLAIYLILRWKLV
jgi:hypothetical protein